MDLTSHPWARPLPLIAIVVVFLALVLPTVDRQGVNWDEQSDLDVAAVYAESLYGMVHGSRDDAINVRLPMYAAGMLFRLIDVDRLRLARLLSVAVSASTLVAVFLLGLMTLGRTKGWVAATILALSPYFLFFGKQALTEGDAWITAAMAWFLVAGAAYARRPTLDRAALLGLSLGLALSCKISALALVPAMAIFLLTFPSDLATGVGEGERRSATSPRGLFLLSAVALSWLGVNLVLVLGMAGQVPLSLRPSETMSLVRWFTGFVLAVWLGSWIVGHRTIDLRPILKLWTALLVGGLAFLLVPPVHTTNPWILVALDRQLLGGGSGLDLGFVVEAILFHVEVITLKSSLVIGVGLWLALGLAVRRRRSQPVLRLALLSIAFYGAFVALLPWAQTRYVMPVMPVLALFAADGLVDLYRARRKVALALTAVATVVLGVDLALCYPDLNLNGYPWVKERYLTGRSTVGYRGIVHTPSDGIEQAVRWTRDHAEAGQRIVTIFGELHITRAQTNPSGVEMASLLHDSVGLEDADWVITSINYDIVPHERDNPDGKSIFGYPYYDRAQLESEFRKVLSIRRAFDLEVAAVWRRIETIETTDAGSR